MEWLNYHHLYYFSVIAQEGGIAAASRKLRVTHSTLSAQLRTLEAHFDVPLFERRGKRLVLTSFGAEAASYASDIFRLGRELNDVARGRGNAGREILRIGVVSALPKTLAHHLLGPAFEREGSSLVVRQDTERTLLESLVAGRLNLVLTNEVPSQPPGTKLHSHCLGQTDILWFARVPLAAKAKRSFPQSLSGMPFILPSVGMPLRRRLDAWFAEHDLSVQVRAEVDDAGLLRVFGSAGRGVFPVRAAVAAEIEDLRDVKLVGPCKGVHEKYYAVSTERRIGNRIVAAIVDAARAGLNPPEERPR